MEIQKQPYPGACFPTAVAIVIGVPVQEILEDLPDGREIIWRKNKKYQYRGFHPQEIKLWLLQHGWAMIDFLVEPFLVNPERISRNKKSIVMRIQDLESTIEYGHNAVLGYSNHAVAWDGRITFDPDGSQYSGMPQGVHTVDIIKSI